MDQHSRGYPCTDDEIRAAICQRLAQVGRITMAEIVSEHLDASDVSVQVLDGKVILEGTVPERRMRHYLEDLVDACPGVQDVDNRVTVRDRAY